MLPQVVSYPTWALSEVSEQYAKRKVAAGQLGQRLT